jgi:hypothetical protein
MSQDIDNIPAEQDLVKPENAFERLSRNAGLVFRSIFGAGISLEEINNHINKNSFLSIFHLRENVIDYIEEVREEKRERSDKERNPTEILKFYEQFGDESRNGGSSESEG